MKDSVKANLIVFLIIAVIAFCISTAFASLTITPKTDSYKLIPIENDSFEPNYIEEVPTILPPVENITNNTTTNETLNTTDYDIEDWNDTDYYSNNTLIETYTENLEIW